MIGEIGKCLSDCQMDAETYCLVSVGFFFSSRRRHTRLQGDWSSDVCSSDLLRSLCSECTLAVLPTHLCGRVADVATAVDCARAVGAWVVEDAAQALGARLRGEPVGWQGDVGFYSLARSEEHTSELQSPCNLVC